MPWVTRHRTIAGPLGDGLGQGGEEDVIDARVEDGGELGDERAGFVDV